MLRKHLANNIETKLNSALQYIQSVLVVAASNTVKNYEELNSSASFFDYRYNISGRYVKKNKADLTPSEIIINSNYDSNLKTHTISEKKKWFYTTEENINRFTIDYECNDSKLTPLEDPQFALGDKLMSLLAQTILVIEKRSGNCLDRCALLLKYLWENNIDIERIEIIKPVDIDHGLVVVNRKLNSDLNQPDGWGEAWVIDGYYKNKGIIIPSNQFKQQYPQLIDYVIDEQRKVAELSLQFRYVDKADEKSLMLEQYLEVNPQIQKYPTYQQNPFIPIEQYYVTNNAYTKDIKHNGSSVAAISIFRNDHKEKFKNTLSCIKKETSSILK